MNQRSGIYSIRHRESGKEYIGRSIRITDRWLEHKRFTEQNKDRSPLHRAFRKYGYDAFDWKVLIYAPVRLHVTLERQFMRDRNTLVPSGYNVGGAGGGRPSWDEMSLMGEEEREATLAEMRENSKKMHAATAERRKDPAYEANYLKMIKERAFKREIARRQRIANDPDYAAKEAARRTRGGVKSQETRKAREAADPELAAKRWATASAAMKAVRRKKRWTSGVPKGLKAVRDLV